jgi:anti-sigma factor RsiW
MMPLLLRRQMVCIELVELVTDYLEGALSRSARRRFESHLAHCPDCTEYVSQIQATITLTGRAELPPMSEGLLQDFAELYQRWMSS